MSTTPFYKHHVFICTNKREDGSVCCANGGAQGALEHLRKRIKELNLLGKGKVRLNSSGCLGRCDEGPIIVIYPEEVWYNYVDNEDIDEIIDSHLVKGKVVERLKI
ncbi:MAG TPA: (2Fe-2S) ferredoxin domain-containing protein [Burkholderiaceae bacterium]|jgi:(2Fe-2S) ferredoxin|nr:(2Fe-2S) ferredoxin domain-containing protein [Burkholderiaceae bacterium]